MDRLTALGAEVLPGPGDVAVPGRRTAARWPRPRSASGGCDGIFHAAGVYRPDAAARCGPRAVRPGAGGQDARDRQPRRCSPRTSRSTCSCCSRPSPPSSATSAPAATPRPTASWTATRYGVTRGCATGAATGRTLSLDWPLWRRRRGRRAGEAEVLRYQAATGMRAGDPAGGSGACSNGPGPMESPLLLPAIGDQLAIDLCPRCRCRRTPFPRRSRSPAPNQSPPSYRSRPLRSPPPCRHGPRTGTRRRRLPGSGRGCCEHVRARLAEVLKLPGGQARQPHRPGRGTGWTR